MKAVFFISFLFVTLFFTTINLHTQNLVPNSGFEDRVNNELPRPLSNPDNANGLSLITRRNRPYDPKIVQHWVRGTQATPDYFHVNATPPSGSGIEYGVLIPDNLLGSQTTVDGSSAYAGFTFNRPAIDGTPDYREYLAVKLISPVEIGKTYQITFKYSTAEYPGAGYERGAGAKTPYSIARLGALCLSESTLDYYQNTLYYYDAQGFPNQNYLNIASTNTRRLPFVPSVEVRENNGYYSQDGWKEFKATFTHSGTDAEYLIIGNFQEIIPLSDIQLQDVGDPPNQSTTYNFYFYVDNVELIEVSPSCRCDNYVLCITERDVEAQATNPGKCCFKMKLSTNQNSCLIYGINIKKDGQVIKSESYTPAIPNNTDKYINFCVDSESDAEFKTITVEYLDASGNVMCTGTTAYSCNCSCAMAGLNNILPGVDAIGVEAVKVNDQNGKCCFDIFLKNNMTCNFINGDIRFTFDRTSSSTEVTGGQHWTAQNTVLQNNVTRTTISNPNNLLANSNQKIATYCISSSPNKTYLNWNLRYATSELNCANDLLELSCENIPDCCDQLIPTLRSSRRQIGDEIIEPYCDFELLLKQKSSLNQCKVYGVRLKNSNGTVLINNVNTQNAISLNSFDRVIGYVAYGPCDGTGNMVTFNYTIEYLDINGALLCPPQTLGYVCCTLANGPSNKSAASEYTEPAQSDSSVQIKIFEASDRLEYNINHVPTLSPIKLLITNIKGQTILSTLNFPKNHIVNGEFDLANLASGVYFIVVEVNGNIITKKFSIIR